MFFLRRNSHTNPLLKDCNTLKFHDKIALEKSILIHKSFKYQLPQTLNSWFGLSSNFHTHNTRRHNLGCLNIPSHRTELYEGNSACISEIFTCNYIQNLSKYFQNIQNILFHKLTTNNLKRLLTLHFMRKYVWNDFSHNVSCFILTALKIDFLFNWNWFEILFSRFSVAFEEDFMEIV